MSQLLIESRSKVHTLTLCEGVKPKTPGCLGTLKGVCSDFINPTRNNNFYSRRLWENTFNNDLVKEALECKVLIGELDHPGDRLETKASESAIVMTDYNFNDQEGVLEGTFDILNTPKGQILKSLIDYGCKVGVSSRGEGDIDEGYSDGVNHINEDTYYFVAFDAVLLPAALKAKPSLVESVQHRRLSESLLSQIETARTQSELDTIKKVIETVSLPESGSLMESVDHKSKELEGVNSSSCLLDDLEESSQSVIKLEEQVRSLKAEVVNYKSRLKRFLESRLGLIRRESELTDQCELLEGERRCLSFNLTNQIKLTESLQSRVDELSSEVSTLTEQLSRSRRKQSRLESESSALNRRYEESLKEIDSLEKKLSSTTSRLEESLRSSSEDLRVKDSENKRLKESLKNSSDRFKSVLVSYAKRELGRTGISEFRGILESVNSRGCRSLEDVDRLLKEEVDRRDRYRKLDTVNDPTINSLANRSVKVSLSGVPSPEDKEDQNSLRFMEGFYKL